MKWLAQHKLLLFFALLKFIIPFILIHPAWELHRDEYLYYQQGQHLAFGYLENPPLIGILAALSSWFGGGWFWIKCWPALFGSATLLLTAAMAKELGGKTFAQCIAALGLIFSAYMRIHFLFQPNFLDIFCWTLASYFLIRYINTKQTAYLYYLSVALAIGWWSKYSVLFFVAAIIFSILLTRHRIIFTDKHFWLAILTWLVIITPNLAWQYFHNFPLLHHMQELRDTQLRYINKTDFFKEQLLMLLPFIFVWTGGLVWLILHKNFRAVAYTYIIVIVLLVMGSGKGYYSLGAYPMLIAAGGVWLEKVSAARLWLRFATVAIILALSLLLIPLLLPLQSPASMEAFNKKHHLQKMGILKWEDQRTHPLQQDFADMLGWKELTSKAEKFYQGLSAEHFPAQWDPKLGIHVT